MLTEEQFWLLMEGEIIKTLLGDIPTFTTEQYRQGWLKWMTLHFGPPPDGLSVMDANDARKQLTFLAPLIIQVETDVWLYQGERNNSDPPTTKEHS